MATQSKNQLKHIALQVSIGITGLLLLGVLSYRFYHQWQDMEALSHQIQALPTATASPLPAPAKVDPDRKVALEKDRIALDSAITGTWVQAIGGLFFFITAYFTARNLQVAQKNLQIAEDKQIADRFSQAIEQLGSDKIAVRLGSIYSLERIAKNSPPDYWTVMEVLAAFIRERLAIQQTVPYSNKTDTENLTEEPNQSENEQFLPGVDYKAALTVIGRRDSTREKGELMTLDLSGTTLNTVNLMGANLSRVNLSQADLIGANLNHTNLSHTNLSNTHLSIANLNHTDLSHAQLRNAKLIGSYLVEANLSGSDLGNADLSGAELIDANLSSTNLSSSNLCSANLSRTNLSGAYLYRTNLREADLTEINLSNALIINADLRTAKALTQEQLEGKKPPLLCNVALPEEIKVNPSRDCDCLSQILLERYPKKFTTLKEAQDFVNTAKLKQWNI